MGKNDGARDCNTELCGKRVVEEFVIGAPPERVVDHDGSVQDGVFDVCPIKRNVVGDAVDNNTITARFCHFHPPDFDKLSLEAIDLHVVNLCNDGTGKSVFHSENNTNLFHCCPPNSTPLPPSL